MACGGCAGAKSQPLAIVAACFSQPTQLGGVLHGFRGNGARLRALVRRGADRFGELGLDQGLADGFGGLADAVADIGDLECVQGFEQGRLVQGHRVVPLYRFLGGFLQRLTRWPDQRDQARREDQDLHHSRQCQSDHGSAGSLYHSVPFVAWSRCAAGRAGRTDRRGLRGAWQRPH